MKRRDFITAGALATAGFSSLLEASCRSNAPKQKSPAPTPPANATAEFELNEESISSLQEKMASGKFSSEQITNSYLNRIGDIDRKGPLLNAVIELNPDAIAVARALDAERKVGKMRGPLHGIPILIKDNIN